MARFETIATRASGILLAFSAVLLFLWLILGPLHRVAPGLTRMICRVVPVSWTKTCEISLSSAAPPVKVVGTAQYLITADADSWFFVDHKAPFKNLALCRIALVPVYSKEMGPDGKPMFGLYDPELIVVVRLRLSWMIGSVMVGAVLPTLWWRRRSRERSRPGFPVGATTAVTLP